jgi:hypothetical protein
MNKYLQVALATTLYIGTVDLINGGVASVEVTASDNKMHQFEMPVLMFPCEIKEQDMFYFAYVNEVIEIRCGEPPI